MIKSRFLVHLSALLLAGCMTIFGSSSAYGKTSVCSQLLVGETKELVFGEHSYTHVPNPLTLNPREIFADYSPNDIYVGFSMAHTYVLVDGVRYDGGLGMNFHPPKVRAKDTLTLGVVVRIKADSETAQELKRLITTRWWQAFSATCSQGVCSFMKSAGMKLPFLHGLVPSIFLQTIMKRGIETKDGRRFPVELYSFGDVDMEKSITYNRTAEVVVSVLSPPGFFVIGSLMYLVR